MTNTVLYIDDDFQLPERVDEILAQAGYQLVHTADPTEALRIAGEELPALVLMEVLLSERDGFELIKSIQNAAGSPQLPIVVVTKGERTPQLYGRSLELGVEDFLCKPVVGAQILEAVLAFADKRRDRETQTPAAAPAAKFLEGSLEDQHLPQLLARLHRSGASGVLTLERGSEARSVQLRNGSPIEVEKHRNVASVAEYLRTTGRIDSEQYEMLVDHLMANLGGPCEILLGMEAISETQLAEATQEQAYGVLLEMFEWTSGQFNFQPDKQLDCAEILEVVCDPRKLVLEGVKRISDEVIHDTLDLRSSFYVCISEDDGSDLEGLGLSPDERSSCESLLGERTLAEVLASEPLTERLLYGLYAAGALLLDEIPVLMLDQELKLEELVEIPTLPRPLVPLRDLPSPLEQPCEIEQAPTSYDDGSARALDVPLSSGSMIDEIDERLESRDDFALFRIDDESRDGDVRVAYDRLLGYLRIDDIPRENEELLTRVRALRVRLDQAYQRVRTEDIRSAFAGLRNNKKKNVEPKVETVGSRAIDAESWFRTGEGFLNHEDYGQAVEAFGMAMHLDPDQGDYAACLGYSLYRSHPNNSVMRREALEHVAKGVKLSPGREKPLLFLSRIFRETGDISMAGKILRRALSSNPDSPVLIQEMCLIQVRGAKSKPMKLLDRLLRR